MTLKHLTALWIVVFNLCGALVQAQQYHFTQYSLYQGLTQSQVRRIFPDSRGFLWVATEGSGISCFDGVSFINYSTDEGLSGNMIRSVFEDKNGNLWLGVKDHFVSIFNGTKFYNIDSLYPGETIFDMVMDKTGNIFLGGNDGLYVYENKRFRKISLQPEIKNINCMRIDADDKIWIGTSEYGIFEYIHGFARQYKGNFRDVFCFGTDFFGNRLFGTSHGVFIMDNDNLRPFSTPAGQSMAVRAIITDKTGNTWFGTMGDGIYRFDGKKWTHFNKSNGLPSDYIMNLLEDEGRNIWIGTNGGGLCKYEGEMFTHYGIPEGLGGVPVMTINADKQGNIWLGTFGKGAFKYDGKKFIHYGVNEGLTSQVIYSIACDYEGNLWMGSEDNGLFIYNGKHFRHFTRSDGFYDGQVLSLMVDHMGNVWAGTYGAGVFVYCQHRFIQFSTNDGLSTDNIFAVFEDSKHNIWLGTESKGVDMLYIGDNFTGFIEKKQPVKNNLLNISSNLGLRNNEILSITEDQDGNIWLGSFGGGIYRFDPDRKITPFTRKDGLVSNNIFFVFCDKQNQIWAGSDAGITKITIDRQTGRFNPVHFGKEDGFAGVETNLNAYYQDKTGCIWIGTINGVTMYNPSCEKVLLNAPKLYVTSVSLSDGEPEWENPANGDTAWHMFPGNFVIHQSKIHITFHWTGIDLNAPGKVRYSYMLEGYDTVWSKPSPDKTVTFTYLTPGNYCFRVISANGQGVWNTEPVSVSFRIISPYHYLRWLFFGGPVFVIVVLMIILRWRRVSHEKEKEQLEDYIEVRTNQILNEKLVTVQQKEKLLEQAERLEIANRELEKLSLAASKTDNAIVITDSDYNIEWANDGFTKLTGYTLDDFIKEKGRNLLQCSYSPDIEEILRKCVENKESVTYSNQFITRNGDKRWFQTTLTPIFTEEGIKQIVAIDSDITYLKEINEKLEMLSLVASKTDNSVIIMDKLGNIEWVNEGFHRMYQMSLEECKKMYGNSICDIPKNSNHKELIEQSIAELKSQVFIGQLNVGQDTEKWIQTVLTPIFDNQQLVKIIAVESDITRLKEAEYEIQSEKEKTDSLLLNILPPETAEELKVRGYATPRFYKNVSVVFADFEDFTHSCEHLSPQEIVTTLQFYFGQFDDISDKYFVEKIKTIGDAYMCVGGLPIPNRSHAFDTVLFALELQQFINDLHRKGPNTMPNQWRLRIGIHTGPVVAGVVGKKKFIYDIWGDTVNIASRMEGTCEPGKINISGAVFDKIKNFFVCNYRGKIEVKNRGAIDMYYIEALKPEYSVNGMGRQPNERFKTYISRL